MSCRDRSKPKPQGMLTLYAIPDTEIDNYDGRYVDYQVVLMGPKIILRSPLTGRSLFNTFGMPDKLAQIHVQ